MSAQKGKEMVDLLLVINHSEGLVSAHPDEGRMAKASEFPTVLRKAGSVPFPGSNF